MKKTFFLAFVLGLWLPSLSAQMRGEHDFRSQFVPLDTARYDYQVAFPCTFHAHILANTQWPQNATEAHQTVQCEAKVSPEGKFTEVRITKSGGAAFDAEALRILGDLSPALPAWKDGKPVESACRLNIVFDKEAWEKHVAEEKAFQEQVSSGSLHVDPEENPHFPGGVQALKQYMYSSFDGTMPKGSVIYTFTIGADGRMREIECIRSPEEYTEAQLQLVHDVMQRMSREIRWIPLNCHGRYMECKWTLPFRFK